MNDAADGSSSLLRRLQAMDQEAWTRMVEIYYPLVYGWCQGRGLQPQDAADVSQEVFRAVFSGLQHFQSQRGQQGFRAWLRGITRHKLVDFWRARGAADIARGGSDALVQMAHVAEFLSAGDSRASPADEEGLILRRALELMRGDFEPRTFEAFWRVTVDEVSPARVAGELGLSVNAVYLARCRVLRRLREELQGLCDGEASS